MARALADLERDIRDLSQADKERLLDFLVADIESAPAELRRLVRELSLAVDRTSRSLDETLAHLAGRDERLERQRIRVRQEVLSSKDPWPFPERPGVDTGR